MKHQTEKKSRALLRFLLKLTPAYIAETSDTNPVPIIVAISRAQLFNDFEAMNLALRHPRNQPSQS
jgi:hypothetical protein